MKKIIDYFPFFIEKELLELRVHLLKDYVDKFIISELNKTHNGDDKEFICKKIIDELNLPKEKIQVIETIIPDDEYLIPDNSDYVYSTEAKSTKIKNWTRERLQRDALMSVIDNYDDDTVFIISDCDEIINPEYLSYFSSCCRNSSNNIIKVPLVLLEGRADKRLYEGDVPADWSNSLLLCNKKQLSNGGSPTKFRGGYDNPFSPVWITENGNRINDCGWHFTWMGDENLRKYKAKTTVLSDNLSYLNTLSSESMKDVLGIEEDNNNLKLKNYPHNLLPKIIFDLHNVKTFLLPEQEKSSPTVNLTNLDDIDWGFFNLDTEDIIITKDYVKTELEHGIYTKFFDVEEGDIVFDIGASVGLFPLTIAHKNPKEIHCFEPHKDLFRAMKNNLSNHHNVILNCCAIGDKDELNTSVDTVFYFHQEGERNNIDIINFKNYVDKNKISKIDFLKTDCEGGEWSIFTKENYSWIKKNVRKIAGEFHLHNQYMKESFITFRDLYLKNSKNAIVFLSNKYAEVHNISDLIWNNEFVFNNLDFCNASFEFDNLINFNINSNSQSTSWIVDNFYENPDEIRKFVLEQDYDIGGIGRGYIGNRTYKQFLFPELKEKFENVMGKKITKWEEYGMNGRFQYCWSGQPLVYHCDSQKWGGMLYLTPNAPYQCGTTLYAHKKTRARTYYDQGWNSSWIDVPGDCHLDGTPFEPVDVFGNVYNRLVIFDASCIHSASEYFGTVKENCRLWQMFFFDAD